MEEKEVRRITSACLLQTIKFESTNDVSPKQEFEMYCDRMNRRRIKYAIEGTEEKPDGTLYVKIKKQYNTYKTDGYFE